MKKVTNMDESRPRILCVDDEPFVLNALRREVGRRFHLITATSGSEGLQRLQDDGPFAVIVADYKMPMMNGLDFLRRAHVVAPASAKAMLTFVTEFELAVNAFHVGHIHRFITKPWTPDGLLKALDDCLEHHEQIMQQEQWRRVTAQSENEMIRAARIDCLMQIWNRPAFDDYHHDLHVRVQAGGGTYTLALADVDHFKQYNDRYGHLRGDEALAAVARALKSVSQEKDFVARYGGEEIVILSDTASDERQAVALADRCRRAVWDINIPHDDNDGFGRVTISTGVALCRAAESETPGEVLQRADAALYQAKKLTGRNRVVLAAPTGDISCHI